MFLVIPTKEGLESLKTLECFGPLSTHFETCKFVLNNLVLTIDVLKSLESSKYSEPRSNYFNYGNLTKIMSLKQRGFG